MQKTVDIFCIFCIRRVKDRVMYGRRSVENMVK